jgi:hypothetical protein
VEDDQERRGYLRLVAKGHMSEEELEKTLAALNEVRRTAGRKLEAIGERSDGRRSSGQSTTATPS